MSGPAKRKNAVSWLFDGSVLLLGASIGALALLGLARGGAAEANWWLAMALGVPVIVLMSRFPLVLTRDEDGIEVGFDSAVLVFLVCYDGGRGALAVWAVGQALSQLTTSKRPVVRGFNIGLGIVSGYCALVVMRSISSLEHTSPRELLAVGLGCAAYFVVDYVVSAVSLALEERLEVGDALRQSSGLAALGVFVAIDSLGFLAALVERRLPTWASLLLAVPLVTILVATRALSRGNEHQRRLAALFEAAAATQSVRSHGEVAEVLRGHARAVVARNDADLRAEPPSAREIGARVRGDADERWLVAPAKGRARSSVKADQRALEALATVGEEAFARLRLVDEMGHLARHDSLTGLPNRTLLLDRVEHAVARSRRHGQGIAVLFLDLDGFKSVNDRFGHAAGDDLLKTVSERLVSRVREGDSVARLGGDEFAILLEDVSDLAEVEMLCHRLLAALRAEIVIGGHDVVVGTSIGVALAAPDDDAAGLLRNADMAMYRAKALGKDRFFVYQPSLREENIRRFELVEALRRGIADDLVVHYQPVVELDSGRVDGMEALVRWRRDGLLVPPDAFISVAEESGLIVEIGEKVLAQVVADAPLLVAAYGGPLNLGLNMSALQLREPAFLEHVCRAVAALAGLHESRLVLEMTETVVVQDDAETDDALRGLKGCGALLAIDDFGVGFSSIGYLQHLPVDIIKVDRSFTRDLDDDPRAVALAEAILVMGAAMDLTVVAEGIERQAQVDRLRAAGFRVGQGFLFGRPQPLGEALRRLGEYGEQAVAPAAQALQH